MNVARPFLIATILILQGACSNPPYPRGDVDSLFQQGRLPSAGSVEADEPQARVHFVRVGGQGSASILFVHGTPGDWKAFAPYLDRDELRALGTLISVDRPGFGASTAFSDLPDFSRQVEMISQLLGTESSPTLVVGHSYGGAIAARMALDYPERVRGALLIAPSIAAPLESPRWYNKLADLKIVQCLLPDELILSNRELMPLQAELATLENRWSALRRPVWVLQGMQDKLVDPRTSDYAERRLPEDWRRVIRMKDAGHFVLWNRPELVSELIREMWAL